MGCGSLEHRPQSGRLPRNLALWLPRTYPRGAMTHAQERRSPTTSRVPLETLVEICGNEPGIPAFEAEALDVSAQGMHLRTAYLPDEGAPLVCRFEDHGREIVVEGVVAWRKESSKGGDFGVAFTALDSRSVDALRALVKSGDAPAANG